MSETAASLSIVTVGKADAAALARTVQSIRAQSAPPYELVLVVSQVPDAKNIAMLDATPVRAFIDTDHGLYDAMNIGLRAATGTHVLFLNAGDTFETPRALARLTSALRPGYVHLFRTLQVNGTDGYVRPATATQAVMHPPHQGFIAPLSRPRLPFNQKLRVAADMHWMRQHIGSAEFVSIDQGEPLTRFSLGGLSNWPSPRSIQARFRDGWRFGAIEVIKYALRYAVGRDRYFRLLARRHGYRRVDLSAGGLIDEKGPLR